MLTKEYITEKLAKLTAQYDRAMARDDLDRAERIAQQMHPLEMALLDL